MKVQMPSTWVGGDLLTTTTTMITAYTYAQKLHEVYQWRHGVFNRVRDADKVQPLAASDLLQLGSTPVEGGLQLDIRVAPKHF